MSVTPEYIKKELIRLEKKVVANETTRKEALEALDKADSTRLSLQREAVALRTLAAGGVPKSSRPAIAQQLAEVMNVNYDEASIMELITKYEKQDAVTEPVKPVASKPSAPKVVTPAKEETSEETAKRRGRPKMSDEEKAERAKARALAAAAAAAVTPPVAEEEPTDDDEEYFDPADYDEE
jgi:hypothetical protein